MMETIRRTMQFTKRQWLSHIRSRDYWCTLFILGVFFSLFFADAGAYVRSTGEQVGIFSVYPVSMMNQDFILLVYTGLLLVVSDFTDLFAGEEYALLRIGRNVWYAGECLSMILTTVTYFFCLFIMELLFYLPNLLLSGKWGSAVVNGTAFLGETYTLEVPAFLLREEACYVALSAFTLSVLLGIFFAMICCVFNLLEKGEGMGILICTLLIMLYFIARQNGWDMGVFSPVGILGSYYHGTWITVGLGICYNIFWITLCILIGVLLIKKKDFRIHKQGD